MILVVLGLRSSQGILGIVKLGKRSGIGVVGIGQLGIGIAQSSLEASGSIDGSLVASVGSVQLDQLIVARRARGKRGLVVDSLKIGLECLIAGKLGLGLDDLEVRIDDGFVGGLELLLGIGDTGHGSVIGGLGVVDRLLGAGEALEGLVCAGQLTLGVLGLRLRVGQGLLLGINCLLGVRKSGRSVRICGLSLVNASLGSVVGLLGIVKRALLVRKVRLGGIALGGKVLDRSRGVVIRLIGLIGLCLGGIAGAASLRLVSSGIGCLRLAVSKRGVCLIESCLGSSGLALGGVELGLGRLDVDTLEFGFGGVVCRLRGGGAGLGLLVLALGGVHVHIGCGESVLGGTLPVYSCEVSFPSSSKVLLRLGELALKLLELRLLRLRAACVVGRVDVVVHELLELGDSEISLTVIRAIVENGYLGIGVLTATGCDADSLRTGIDDVEIVPTLIVDAVVVPPDIGGIISMTSKCVTILFDVLIEFHFLLGVETGIWPSESVLGFAAGICTAAASKIFPIVVVALRVSPNVR